MALLDIAGDARRTFNILKAGGVAIWPNDVGYGMVGATRPAVQKIFETKGRGRHKRNALLCNSVTQREVHQMDTRGWEIVEALTNDFNLPLGVIGRLQPDHPMVCNIDPELMEASTANGTIGILLNAGPLYEELCALARNEMRPLLGSSANVTGTGAKFRVEDIQPEIKAAADIVVDYGLRKYNHYKRSATILDLSTGVEVLRIGSCYDLIADALKRYFKIILPADPGREALPSGHLKEFALGRFR